MQRMAGESAAAAVIDVTNGDIDRAGLGAGVRSQQLRLRHQARPSGTRCSNDEYRPLSNKTVTGTYPPGSTFKMRVALAALEAGVVQPRRQRRLRRLHRARQPPLPLLEARRPRPRRPAPQPLAVLRLLLLRDGPPARPRPDQRHGAAARPRASRHDLPMPAVSDGQHARRRLEEGEARRDLDHRRQLQLRHRPGLHPGLAAAARGDDARASRAAPRSSRGSSARSAACRSRSSRPRRSTSTREHLRVVRDGMFAVSNEGTAYRSRIVDPRC